MLIAARGLGASTTTSARIGDSAGPLAEGPSRGAWVGGSRRSPFRLKLCNSTNSVAYLLARALDQPPSVATPHQLGAALQHVHGPHMQPVNTRQTLSWQGLLRGWWRRGGTGHSTRWGRVLKLPAGTPRVHQSSLQLAGTAAARHGWRSR